MIFSSVGQNTIKDIREHFNADEWLDGFLRGWLPSYLLPRGAAAPSFLGACQKGRILESLSQACGVHARTSLRRPGLDARGAWTAL